MGKAVRILGSTREGTVFTGVCLFTSGGVRVPTFQVAVRGVPTFPGLNGGRGVPTFPGLDGRGVPTFPGLDGGGGYLPSQVWMGGYLPSQVWTGGTYLPRWGRVPTKVHPT